MFVHILVRLEKKKFEMAGQNRLRSQPMQWCSPVAIACVAILLIIGSLIDTSIVEREELVQLSGDQPGFARVIGGDRFGDQIAFADDSPERCVLATAKSRATRAKIVSGTHLNVLCDPIAARAYVVEVDGQILVSYEDTVRSYAFENRLRSIVLPLLVGLLALQIIGGFLIARFRRR